MAKMLLLSIVVALVALPIVAAREENASRALKKTLMYYLLFNAAYLLAIKYFYFRFV